MSEELYLTGPVIVNGIPDSDNDTLNSREIRTIFTKYTNHLSDIQHDRIDYDGVDVLANWISEDDTIINGNTIPAKSWLATVKVTDPETLTAVENGELTCFSLGSISSTGKTRRAWFIDKRISYHDLKDMEDVIPLRISLVDKGACGFPFEIEEREVYINKNMEENKMANDETTINDTEAKFSFKEWLGIEKHFKNNIDKAEETPAPAEEDATSNAEQNIQALFDRLDAIEAKIDTILNADIEKAEEEEKEDEKATDGEETEPEKDEEEINKEDTEESSEKPEKEEEDKEPEETEINKSVTNKPGDQPHTEHKSNFYANTGRDAFGRKIRR